MPVLDYRDHLPGRPERVLVGGTSGSGKTTLARRIADLIGAPHAELDALHHGPGWTVRPSFNANVASLAAHRTWVTEYQYVTARPLLLSRCDLLVYLLLPRSLVMARVLRRTIHRSLRREVLWNGNIELPLRTIFTDRDHVVRWAWRTHGSNAERIAELQATRPEVPVVVLRSGRHVTRWLDGPLAAALS